MRKSNAGSGIRTHTFFQKRDFKTLRAPSVDALPLDSASEGVRSGPAISSRQSTNSVTSAVPLSGDALWRQQ